MAKVKRVTKNRAGNCTGVSHILALLLFQPFYFLLQGISDLQTSRSGIFRHCGAHSLFGVTQCFDSTSPLSLSSLPRVAGAQRGTRAGLSLVHRGLNHMAVLCGSERPPLNCDIYCFTFPFFHLNGRIVHLLPPILCPWFVLF